MLCAVWCDTRGKNQRTEQQQTIRPRVLDTDNVEKGRALLRGLRAVCSGFATRGYYGCR